MRAWAGEQGLELRDVPAHQCAGGEAELRAAVAAGFTLASHTWSHPNLVKLGDGELAEELVRPQAWLRERFTNVRPWLAYPYGSADARVAEAARAAGYEGALRIDGGWLPRGGTEARRFLLPRQNVSRGLSRRGFELRVAGVINR